MSRIIRDTNILPPTGQTTSYSDYDDGYYKKGWKRGTRFIEFTSGGIALVKDKATGLIWPKIWNSLGGNNALAIPSWQSAIAYAADNLNTITWAGYSDWRLPNINELCSILDYSNSVNGFFNVFTPTGASSFFWVSTTFSFDSTLAYCIRGLPQVTNYFSKSYPNCLLICCRG